MSQNNVVYFRPTRDASFKVDMGAGMANPAPLGLFAFALTTALLSVANAGLVEMSFENVVWAYALLWGGATQWVAGILEYFKKNIYGATVFTSFGSFWMGLATFKYMVETKAITVTSIQLGMTAFFAVWGILALIFAIGATKVSVALFSVFVPLVPAFFCLLGAQYSVASARAAGWLGILAAALAFYVGTATFLNEVFGSVILPVGSPELIWGTKAGRKAGALLGTAQPDNTFQEYDDEVAQAGKKV